MRFTHWVKIWGVRSCRQHSDFAPFVLSCGSLNCGIQDDSVFFSGARPDRKDGSCFTWKLAAN
jgi:hypothetical protein